jgi:hypothetical protein
MFIPFSFVFVSVPDYNVAALVVLSCPFSSSPCFSTSFVASALRLSQFPPEGVTLIKTEIYYLAR